MKKINFGKLFQSKLFNQLVGAVVMLAVLFTATGAFAAPFVYEVDFAYNGTPWTSMTGVSQTHTADILVRPGATGTFDLMGDTTKLIKITAYAFTNKAKADTKVFVPGGLNTLNVTGFKADEQNQFTIKAPTNLNNWAVRIVIEYESKPNQPVGTQYGLIPMPTKNIVSIAPFSREKDKALSNDEAGYAFGTIHLPAEATGFEVTWLGTTKLVGQPAVKWHDQYNRPQVAPVECSEASGKLTCLLPKGASGATFGGDGADIDFGIMSLNSPFGFK